LTCISKDLTEDNVSAGQAFILYFVDMRGKVTGHSSQSVQWLCHWILTTV